MESYFKYKNIITTVDGIKFHSKKEAKRYQDLKLLQLGKVITDLELQPVIPLMVNGVKIGRYTGDFKYKENGIEVIEDVKSVATKTRDYIIRKKILATYNPPIYIKEV
tara:strand:+ start:585 stop:908 length:324 start_codon:yes stop_codon:yes gene_type:complete